MTSSQFGIPAKLVVEAARLGNTALVEVMVGAGAELPALDPVDAYFSAVFTGASGSSKFSGRARAERPWMLVWAAAQGKVAAVRRLLDDEFPIDVLGRSDRPAKGHWETALHAAAGSGHREVVELLLARGAATDIRDVRFGATAADWARHMNHPDVLAQLSEKD